MSDFWLKLLCSFTVLGFVALSYKFLNQNEGRVLKWHAIYWASAISLIIVLPESAASYIFTDLTITLVGAVYPIYRAIKAACTPFDDDDKEWLSYWMFGGMLFMCTSWVDDVIESDRADDIWYGCLLAVFFWLYFPLTCGALLIYEKVTRPLLGPCLQPVAYKMSAWIYIVCQTLNNATHLYFLWIFFVFLPIGSKRFFAIAVGTVYPFVSSASAAATNELEDDTYWLTYWAVYGVLYLIMDLLETWMGRMPGFYTLIICTTLYLMLPIFRGADKIFRKVMVPLAGLQEMLFLRDSIQIKKQILKDLDPERADLVRKSIAKLFDGEENSSDPSVLKKELKQSWFSLKNPFGKSSSGYDSPKLNLV